MACSWRLRDERGPSHPRARAAAEHLDESADSDGGTGTEPGEVRLFSGILTFLSHPPGSVYNVDPNRMMSPHGFLSSLGGRILPPSALRLWERTGSVTFPSPSASLGWESWVVGRKSLLRLEASGRDSREGAERL